MKNLKKLSKKQLKSISGGFDCRKLTDEQYCAIPPAQRPFCQYPQTLVPRCNDNEM
ncbi:bacteriocin-like protein [Chryseobacterium sp.]|jgi:bacteriocin-like protein|uniref:bacteriocin-like protein n=1 Tax=Chryseobacterium sp. TaxID=1871047 RepID=UPI0038CD60A0